MTGVQLLSYEKQELKLKNALASLENRSAVTSCTALFIGDRL